MTNKVTKTMIQNQFINLCDALGKRVATGWNDVGAWKLDYNPHYGGYTIVEKLENGGESHPISQRRHKGSEFFEMVIFALRAVAIDRNENEHNYWPKDKIVNPRPERTNN